MDKKKYRLLLIIALIVIIITTALAFLNYISGYVVAIIYIGIYFGLRKINRDTFK